MNPLMMDTRAYNIPVDPAVSRIGIRELGLVDYERAWRSMQTFTDRRNAGTPDEIWLLQHPPVFTLGQAGKAEHVLAAGDIPVLHVDRGGQVTYHGPGQIVAYPLIDIRRLGIGVRDLVCRIEQAVIDVLAAYGVSAARATGAPGVYVDGVKIAALGLRVRRGCSFHGLAFNVDMDLEPYQRINPCGFEGLEVTQLAEFVEPDLQRVQGQLVAALAAALGYDHRLRALEGVLPTDGALAT
jgi:lipoyl(octanoyl) transferase